MLAPRLRARAGWARVMITLARREVQALRIALPPADRYRAWRLGFFAASYIVYDLAGRDVRQYISDYAMWFRAGRLRGSGGAPVSNKLALARALTLHGFRHARVYAQLSRGMVYDVDAPRRVRPVHEWLRDRPAVGERIVVKPMAEGSGRGIMFVERDASGLSINGVAASVEEAAALARACDHYLVTEFVEQARYAAEVHPGTTNTVRILTLWDPDDGEPFMAAAAHRFGSARSGPIDNWHGGWGGLSARIDLERGVLGPGATLTPAGRLSRHAHHPDTGAAIAGVQVPGWDTIVANVLEVARSTPEAPMVGWDLVVTEEGSCILEGNAPPGIRVWQVHDPLLADPRSRRFFESYGVV